MAEARPVLGGWMSVDGARGGMREMGRYLGVIAFCPLEESGVEA